MGTDLTRHREVEAALWRSRSVTPAARGAAVGPGAAVHHVPRGRLGSAGRVRTRHLCQAQPDDGDVTVFPRPEPSGAVRPSGRAPVRCGHRALWAGTISRRANRTPSSSIHVTSSSGRHEHHRIRRDPRARTRVDSFQCGTTRFDHERQASMVRFEWTTWRATIRWGWRRRDDRGVLVRSLTSTDQSSTVATLQGLGCNGRCPARRARRGRVAAGLRRRRRRCGGRNLKRVAGIVLVLSDTTTNRSRRRRRHPG